MKTQRALGSILCTFCIVAAASAPALGDPKQPNPIEEGSSTDSRFYTSDGPSQPDRFEGRVVCLRTDKNFAVESASNCPGTSRVIALSMNEGEMVQPVLATNKDVHDDLMEHLDENVIVNGRHYASIGMILATTVTGDDDGDGDVN
jgi:hypothetical protein